MGRGYLKAYPTLCKIFEREVLLYKCRHNLSQTLPTEGPNLKNMSLWGRTFVIQATIVVNDKHMKSVRRYSFPHNMNNWISADHKWRSISLSMKNGCCWAVLISKIPLRLGRCSVPGHAGGLSLITSVHLVKWPRSSCYPEFQFICRMKGVGVSSPES